MTQQRLAASIFSYAYSSLVLALLMCVVDAQIDLQCPSTPLTISNGTINFTPLSEGSGPVDATYNPTLVSRTWYSLANGFVDTVRSGGLPYGKSSSIMYSSLQMCTCLPSRVIAYAL